MGIATSRRCSAHGSTPRSPCSTRKCRSAVRAKSASPARIRAVRATWSTTATRNCVTPAPNSPTTPRTSASRDGARRGRDRGRATRTRARRPTCSPTCHVEPAWTVGERARDSARRFLPRCARRSDWAGFDLARWLQVQIHDSAHAHRAVRPRPGTRSCGRRARDGRGQSARRNPTGRWTMRVPVTRGARFVPAAAPGPGSRSLPWHSVSRCMLAPAPNQADRTRARAVHDQRAERRRTTAALVARAGARGIADRIVWRISADRSKFYEVGPFGVPSHVVLYPRTTIASGSRTPLSPAARSEARRRFGAPRPRFAAPISPGHR